MFMCVCACIPLQIEVDSQTAWSIYQSMDVLMMKTKLFTINISSP